jgi:triose/dihydroxyacetone kinase / FAD-AMP lyase (cyclizing)
MLVFMPIPCRMDALHPFVETLGATNDVHKAANAAAEGSARTKGMKASLGRTVYVGGDDWQKIPDPGAHGLSEFLTGLGEGF